MPQEDFSDLLLNLTQTSVCLIMGQLSMKFVTTENVHQEILSMHYILTYTFFSGFKDLGIFSSSGLENPQLFYTY